MIWICPTEHRIQLRSRNFRTRGRGPGSVKFLGSGDCFNFLSHILYVIAVRVENKIPILNVLFVHLLQLRYICVLYTQKTWPLPSPLKKNKRFGGGGLRSAGIRSILAVLDILKSWKIHTTYVSFTGPGE